MNNQALNFVVKNNSIEVMTTAQLVKKFRKKLLKQAKQNLPLIKDSINFILVSELEKASGTDFYGYIDRSFDGDITKNGITGVNNLITLVKTVATERGITEPCIAYVDARGRRLLVTKEYGEIVFFNAEVKYSSDYGVFPGYDKGNTIYGWRHPSFGEVYEKELEEYDSDFRLVTKKILRDTCSCTSYHDGDCDQYFDLEVCKGCDFYDKIANSVHEGRDVIYVKAI